MTVIGTEYMFSIISEPAFPKCMELLFQKKIKEAYDECLSVLRNSSASEKEKHEALLCHIINSQERYSESDKILHRLCLSKPDDHRLLHNWAAVKRMLGQYDEALTMFAKEKAMIEAREPQSALSVAANEYE